MQGVCKLCLKNKELVRSHLLPRALWEYCRKDDHKPIMITDDVLLATDRQIQYPLLCVECEDVLNDGGEGWMLDKLATYEKTFPLYDLLAKAPPVSTLPEALIYFAANSPDIDVKKIVHFAMGIYWKAAVHSWRGGEIDPKIELGKYSEPLRTWLLGKTAFPGHMYLSVFITPPELAQISMFPPYEAVRQEGWRVHYLYVPGLLFMLNVGKTVDESRKWICTWNNPGHPITFSKTLLRKFMDASGTAFRNARKTHSFLKAMDKVAKERNEELPR
jgi:hypothetical protein